MRICYIASTTIPSRTAHSVHIMKMCEAYAGLGNIVTLVLPDLKGEPGVEDVYDFYGVQNNFAIRRVASSFWQTGLAYSGFLLPHSALKDHPDVVHSRSLGPAWGMSRVFKKPTIFEIHQPVSGNLLSQFLFWQTVRSQYLRSLVVITNALARNLQPSIPASTKLVIASDGVDEAWLRCAVSTEEARIQLSLELERKRIAVYAGNLYPGRGIELILELAKMVPDHLFLIVGGQPNDISRYEKMASHLPNLHLIGFKPPSSVILYLRAADVLLMPHGDHVEVFGGGDISAFTSPMKMFEYMASGKPLIASTLPVLQEVLSDRHNALLIPYDKPDHWVRALRLLQEDQELAAQLGRKANADVAQYTWQLRAGKLLAGL